MAGKCKYVSGDKFNKWTLIEYQGRQWMARCECGAEKVVYVNHLVSGKSKGCMSCSTQRMTHGMSFSKEYRSWTSMRGRCLNPSNDRFHQYGGRGIKICERWSEFENFIADMGARPEGTSLDRIDCDGDYAPDNCRWATAKTQMRNRRIQKDSKLGISITEAAENCDMASEALRARLNRGWDIDRALKEPVKNNDETVRGMARKLGLNPDTIDCRVRRGWNLEKALSTPVKHKQATCS